MNDSGVAAVIGAIVVLAVLGIALVYVNAYHVPKQGEAMEVATSEATERALLDLASALAAAPEGPIAHDVPVRAQRERGPLLSGVVLEPARAEGRLALDPVGSNLTVSVVVNAPAGGIPANDPTRAPVAGGKMRVYLAGNATRGLPLGALRATTGGAYLAPSEGIVEAGAVFGDAPRGSTLAAPPPMALARPDLRAEVTWRVPILAGADAEVSGTGAVQAVLTPGPEAALGSGAEVDEVRILVETPRLAGWREAFTRTVGNLGTITTNGANDAGTVEVVIPQAKLSLFLVRYDVSLGERAG